MRIRLKLPRADEMLSGQRIFRTLCLCALGAFAFLSVSVHSYAGDDDALSRQRQAVTDQCHALDRPLGMSSSWTVDAIREAKTAAELASLLESCQQQLRAYPTRRLDAAASERGHHLYTTLGCAVCHGQDARGGEGGPSLLRSQRVMRDMKGETIGEVVLRGIPNTPMTAFKLSAEQLADLAEFLHGAQVQHLRAARTEALQAARGDKLAGKAYFERKCSGCHLDGDDLKGIGERYRDPQTLQQQWIMPRNGRSKTATVTDVDGSTVTGRLLYQDEFLSTLELADGSRRTFERGEGGSPLLVDDPLAGHRALLPVYTDADIHNVTAYLQSLTELSRPPSHSRVTKTRSVSIFAPKETFSRTTGLSPSSIVNPSLGSWPTYAGDYSAPRFSPLAQVNQSNVRELTLAWTTRLIAGAASQGSYPAIVGGEGSNDNIVSGPAEIRGSLLEVDGVLFLSAADNVWAVDARNGDIRWHFVWKSRGGWHQFGSRGPSMWRNIVFFQTPDDYLVALDALTGKERWHVQTASLEEQYFASIAPVVVGNHVLVGAGNTLNAPGFLQSLDAETGELQWKRYSVPMNKGDPGLETWKDLDAARHGGGQVWMPGAYDPATHLYIYGTGNPTPAYEAEARGNRDALFTCALLAVNVDSGAVAWYYQTSPNDTHDWDSAQTPILADIVLDGRKRQVAMTAARNGYFFVVDRVTGAPLVTRKYSTASNWARPEPNAKGQPVRIPEKDGTLAGALVSSDNQGATNWQPASYSPDYGLYFAPVAESWALYYKTDADQGGAYSMEGKEELPIDSASYLKAIDSRTGKIAWSVEYPSGGPLANGVLSTAGRLLFSGDTAGNLVARDPANGHPLWHTHLGRVSNAPETYFLDKHQFVIIAAGDALYAFRLAQ